MATAAQFSLVPNLDDVTSGAGDFRRPVAGTCGSSTTTSLFQAIDEPADSWTASPCNEYLYADTPVTGTAYDLYQQFALSAPPAGTWRVNALDVRFRMCSTTADDPTVTFSVYAGATLVESEDYASMTTCSGTPSDIRIRIRDVDLSRAQVDDLRVRVRVQKPAGVATQFQIATLNVEGTACTANLCGVARDASGSASPAWAGCPGVGVIKVAVSGAGLQTVNCDANGEFAYTGVVPAGSTVTTYLASAGRPTELGVTYSNVTGTGTTVEVFKDRLTFETLNSVPVTNADVGVYDATHDPWIPVDVTAGALTETVPITIFVADAASGVSPFRPGGNVTATNLVTSGWMRPDANTISLTGSGTASGCSNATGAKMPYCRSGNTMAADTSTVRFTGTGNIEIPSQTYYTLEHVPPSGSPSMNLGTSTVTRDLVIGGAGGTPQEQLNGEWNNLTVGRDFVIHAGSSVTGSDTNTITVEGSMTGAGTFSSSGTGKLVLDAATSGARTFGPTVAGTTWTVNRLEVENQSVVGPATYTLAAGGTGDIVVLGDTTVGDTTDTQGTVLDLDAQERTLDVGATLLVNAQGSLTAPGGDVVRVRDNLIIASGTFNDAGGTVEVQPTNDGTSRLSFASAETFANLTVSGGGRVEFDADVQTTVTGAFTVNGAGCTPATRATLASDSPGDRWDLLVSGTHAVSNAAIQDSNAIAPLAGANPSLDAGNNVNWSFMPGACLPVAPDTFLTEGATRPTTVGVTAPDHSFVNRAGYAVDQQRTQVVTSTSAGVTALWHLDGTFVDAVGANHGAAVNGATATGVARTNFGQALQLDGIDDRMSVPHHASISPTTDFTVEAWFRTTSLTTGGYASIVTKSNDVAGCTATSDCTYSLQYQGPFDRFCFKGIRGTTQHESCGSTRAALNDGEWHHVAGTMTAGNVMQLYVDGEPTGAPKVVGGAIDANASALLVGSHANGSSPFGGQVDEVRISNVARTAAEIRGYYRTQRPHLTTMWDSSPADAGAALASCLDAARCADVTYGTGGGQQYLIADGARYYVRTKVRAAADGVWSAWGSDWFEVAASINVSATPLVSLGTLLPGIDNVGTIQVQVDTNNASGYSLSGAWGTDPIERVATGEPVPDFAPTAPDPTSPWAAGAALGFGVTVLGADTGGVPHPRLARWGTGTDTAATDFTNNRYAGLAVGSPLLLHRRSAFDLGVDTVDVAVRANVPASQRGGSYAADLVVTAVANP